MVNTCRTIEQWLPAYLDSELAPDDRAEVDNHLASCAACRHELAMLRQTDALLAAWEAPAPTSRVHELFQARLVERQPKQSRWKNLFVGNWPRLAWATGIAAVLVLGILLQARHALPPGQSVGSTLPHRTVTVVKADHPIAVPSVKKTGGEKRAIVTARRTRVHHRPAGVKGHRNVERPPDIIADQPITSAPDPYQIMAEAPDLPVLDASSGASPDNNDLLVTYITVCATPESAVAAMMTETLE